MLTLIPGFKMMTGANWVFWHTARASSQMNPKLMELQSWTPMRQSGYTLAILERVAGEMSLFARAKSPEGRKRTVSR